MKLKRIYILSSILLAFTSIAAQEADELLSLSEFPRPTTSITRLESMPIIDGEVLADEVWQNIKPVNEFIQAQPYAGRMASEKTEVRTAYTENMFLLSVICFDQDVNALVVSDARRDAALDDTDAFLFILDTYHDNQNGFIFGTNSIGIEYDAQVDNEGVGNFNANRQQGGTIGGFNLNWDASWEVKTQVFDQGWSAEFAIPLRTLRFRSGDDVTWGINFRRNIRKTNEIAYWSPIPIGLDLKRLSLAGDIHNLSLKNPGNLKIIPYAITTTSKNFAAENPSTRTTFDVGGDIKYSLTPSLTLDLTYNTDFAQVEVDEQQINLDRFNLFFPEKRPFFLENAGLFTVGSPGEVDLFFSRRIGIGEGGVLEPILGGARVSGKVNKTNVGVMSMFTQSVPEDGIDQNNYTTARVNHQLGQRSFIGAAYVSRDGINTEGEDFNRTLALDGKWGIGNKAFIDGFFAHSITPGIEEGEQAFKLKSEYNWNNWELRAAYTQVGEGFNPEVGFLLRESFRKPEGLILYHWRPKKDFMNILELRPHVSYRGYWGIDGFQQTGFLHVDNHWEWKGGFEVHTGINFTVEGVQKDFEISPGVTVPVGRYEHEEAQIVLLTNPSKPLSIRTRHILGGFFGGKRYANSGTLKWRVGDRFTSEWTFILNSIDLPYGQFNSNLYRSRISYSFTPRIYLQGLFQYNDAIDVFNANVRFGWLNQANTGLFIVYNQTSDNGLIQHRSFVVKYSYLFDIVRKR